MKSIRLFPVVSALLLFTAVASAQVPFVNLGYNAEQMAMGVTNATHDGAAAFSDESTVDFSFLKWQPKAANSTMFGLNAAAKVSSRLAILVDGKFNSFPEMQGYDGNGNPSGILKPSQIYGALGASYAITGNFGLSLKAKFVSDKLVNNANANAVCADISFDYHNDGLDLALMAANIGSKLKYGSASYSLPMFVKAGVVKEFQAGESCAVKIAADAGYVISEKSLAGGIGAELNVLKIVGIRAGYHFGSNAEPSFATVGLGVNVSVLRLSAAYLIGPKAAGNTIAASLGFAF